MSRTRAFRRHHSARMRAGAYRKLSTWRDPFTTPEDEWFDWYICRNYNHLAKCSCSMCRNPRTNRWSKIQEQLTMQERKVYNGLSEGMIDYYDERNEEMTFTDWFDPHNPEHCAAYRYVEMTGHLPEGFVPEHVSIDMLWQVKVVAKMGQAWLDHMGRHMSDNVDLS